MSKEDLVKKVCRIYNITVIKSYPAVALYSKKVFRALSGYVVNDLYFIDKQSEEIYDVKDLSQLVNVDEYRD